MVKKLQKTPSEENENKTSNRNGKRPSDDQEQTTQKKFKTKSLYRQPTVSELNRLHETENLFNSNLFRLQVDEVIEEVKVKEKLLGKFQSWFKSFKNSLLSMPANENEYDLSENILFKELKVKLPVGGDLKRTKCSFLFHKFTDIYVSGSFALGCSINSKLCVDIQIVVPSETYTKNDSVNYRYHKKRAAYLACVASYIKNINIIDELKYSWLSGSESKPFIVLKPAGKLGKHLRVRILLSCEEGAYKLHRYGPNRNNVRKAWFNNSESSETNSDDSSPTPYYNSSVLCDINSKVNYQYLEKTLGDCENLKQAIVLLKIWLRQRNMEVSGFIISIYVAHLVQTKRINNIMSSYQIVRNVWICLKSSEWDTKGITVSNGGDTTPSLDDFLNSFPVVFLDCTGYYNICWQMSIGTYNNLRRESSLAVEMLDNRNINSFVPLFMTPFKPIMKFDHILRFKELANVKELVSNSASTPEKLNFGVDTLALVINKLSVLLTKGLGKKVNLILQLTKTDFEWPVHKSFGKAKALYNEELSFGFILDEENALETVDKGPPANFPEAELFRAFWGDKSELRRFQDGSITETCVWSAATLAERRMVVRQIIQYLLQLKYGITSDIYYVGDQLDSVLACKQYAGAEDALGSGEERTLKVLHEFNELRRELRELTDLPLDISSVYGISPVFSYCDPLPPLARGLGPVNPRRKENSCIMKEPTKDDLVKCPPYVPTSTAVIELTHSGKWPSNLEAFRCLKAAFHMQIAERLTKQFSMPTQVHPTHITVLKSGLIFKLEIVHSKELTLLRRELENGVVKHKENAESLDLHYRAVVLPKLRGALHGLHLKHPAFGPTVSLLKRFLSSHLIDDYHFPHSGVELLVASTFLRPEPLSVPTQPLCAFLRVLSFLCSKEWKTEPLIINFNDQLDKEDIMHLEKKFSQNESDKPALCIITPYDSQDNEVTEPVWKKRSPSSVQVLARAVIIASTTLKYIEDSLLNHSIENVLGVFLPSLSDYDVLIHLNYRLVPYSGERVDKKPIPTEVPPVDENESLIPVVDFNPVRRYLTELRKAYSDYALFFHDMYGGEVIAVLWKPDVKETREFHIFNAHALRPTLVNGEVRHEVNLNAIVEDFRIIGEGLVKDITINNI